MIRRDLPFILTANVPVTGRGSVKLPMLAVSRTPVETLELPVEALPELVLRYPEPRRVAHEQGEPFIDVLYLLLAYYLSGFRHDHGPNPGPALDQTCPL